jgi:hypothetical protein
MKDFLYLIIAVVVVALFSMIVFYMDRRITTHWVFWVGVALLGLTFFGVPAAMLSMVRNL